MKIERIRIDLYPKDHIGFQQGYKGCAPLGVVSELTISVKAGGKEFSQIIPLLDDDLTPRFDYMLERGIRELRKMMKESEAT